MLTTACGGSGDTPPQKSSPPEDQAAFRVAIPFKVCPDPADFHKQVDALLAGTPTDELPERCRLLEAGTRIKLPQPDRRTVVTYRQFEFVQGTLANGENVWSDEFSSPLIAEEVLSPN